MATSHPPTDPTARTTPQQGRPPRADAVQPDRPWRGGPDDAGTTTSDTSDTTDTTIAETTDPAVRAQRARDEDQRSTQQLREQTQAALDNVREGYGGPKPD